MTAGGQLDVLESAELKEKLSKFYESTDGLDATLGQTNLSGRADATDFAVTHLDMRQVLLASHSEELAYLRKPSQGTVILAARELEELKNRVMVLLHSAHDYAVTSVFTTSTCDPSNSTWESPISNLR